MQWKPFTGSCISMQEQDNLNDMDPNSLIPYSDLIPAPAWLLIVLEQLLFLLHIIVINAILGGFLILLFRRMRKPGALSNELHQPVADKLPVLFALGVNFAIPPLLFLQVVFGHLFYSSSVLMAVYWILVIPLLVLGYYGAYIHRTKLLSSPVLSKIVLSAAILIVLYVGFILVSNNALMEQPEKWQSYFSNRTGTLLGLTGWVLLPRYLHFLMASIAIGGLFYATVTRLSKKEIGDREAKVKASLQIFAIATSVQVVTGFWYLLSVPSDFLPQFMGQNLFATLFLMLGIIGGITALICGFLNKYILSVSAVLFTLVCMIINRLNLRLMYLGDNFRLSDLGMKPQYGVFALFVVILLIGVGVIIYMLRISSTSKEGRS
jgi:hypothetical protein